MPRKKKLKASGSYGKQARGERGLHRIKPLKLPPDLAKLVKKPGEARKEKKVKKR